MDAIVVHGALHCKSTISSNGDNMYKIVFYVPESHLEQVKTAVFDAGTGRVGCYQKCCWQVLGQGQFIPMIGSSPYLGEIDTLERVAEYRVELVCADNIVNAAIAALKSSHPYEEPAYDVWALANL
jgi:hypothetical protein